jgi:CelD/BcsL family acetyltransferase involved in cellulose biosynthesis
MDIKIFTEFNEDLKALWGAFDLRSNSLPFHSYEWQRYWNEQVGQPKYNMAICVVICTVDSRVRAIFPFGINLSFGARVLSFLGAEEADYGAPLLATDIDSNEFKDIWAAVLRYIPTHDVVFFRNMPKNINKTDNFLLENIKTKESGMSYSTTLPDLFDDYSLRLSKSMLKDNKRMIRRLSEIGELTFKVIEKPEEFKEITKILISQKEARYTLSGARNIFHNEHIKSFYTNMVTLLNRGFNIHLSVLMLDDEILATHLGIHDREQFFYLMPTFNHDDKWKQFSLGRIHLERLINWAIDNRIKKFDFTIGGELYKSNWCNSEMAIYDHLKLRSPKGVFYFLYSLVLEFVKSKPTLKKLVVKIFLLSYRIKNK